MNRRENRGYRKQNVFWRETDSSQSRGLEQAFRELREIERKKSLKPGEPKSTAQCLLPPATPAPSKISQEYKKTAPAKRPSEPEHLLTLGYYKSECVKSVGYFIQFPDLPSSSMCALAADKKDGEWIITRHFRPYGTQKWDKQEFKVPKGIDQHKIINALVRWAHAARACNDHKAEYPRPLDTHSAIIITHQIRSCITPAFDNSGDLVRLNDIGKFPPLSNPGKCYLIADPLLAGGWKVRRVSLSSQGSHEDEIIARPGVTFGQVMDSLGSWAYAAGVKSDGKYEIIARPGPMLVVARYRQQPIFAPDQATKKPDLLLEHS
jgi:hypothetical protein